MAAKRTSFEEVGWEDMPDDANVGPHNVRRAQVAVSSIIVDERFGRVHDDSLIEAEIIQLRQTLSPDGAETVSARVIQDHLSHHPIASIPSLRTIYHILNRQSKKGASQSVTS